MGLRAVIAIFLIVLSLTLAPSLRAEVFTPQQKALFDKLESEKQSFAVVRSPKGRIVFILGERHVKPEQESNLAREAVDLFPRVGFEGADLRKYWGGRIAGYLLMKYYRALAERNGHNLSSIKELPEMKTTALRHLESDHEPDLAESMTIGGVAGLATGVTGFTAAFTGAQVCNIGLRTLAHYRPSYKPLLRRGVNGFAIGAAPFFMLGAGSLAAVVLAPDGPDPDEERGIVGNRNVTMARSTADWDRDLPDTDPVMLLMGAAHIPGMLHQLKTKYQYQLLRDNEGWMADRNRENPSN